MPQPAEPEGLRFVGWRTNTDPADVPETTLCSDNEDEENEYQLKPAGAKVKAITYMPATVPAIAARQATGNGLTTCLRLL